MTLLVVQKPGARLGIRGESFVITAHGELVTEKPIHQVSSLQLYGSVDLTTAAREVILRRHIDTVFLSGVGAYRGRLVTAENPNAARRAAQYRTLLVSEHRLALARRIVEAKIRNQRALLVQAQRHRPTEALASVLATLRGAALRADSAEDMDVLRGIEGYAARAYFGGLGEALTNPAFEFRGRVRRPPTDPVNAMLSYGYTILLTRVESAVRRIGLDPCFGALHDAGRGAPALALDLMEEFRPLIIDRLVVRLVNRRQVSPDDFAEPSVDERDVDLGPGWTAPGDEDAGHDGAVRPCHLTADGRSLFLRELYSAFRATVPNPTRPERMTVERAIEAQCLRLARFTEHPEDGWEPLDGGL